MTFVPVTAVLVAMMFFTVCTTRDYLMWNRLRWVAANDLMTNEHVQPDEMDGGFEFNGLYFFVPHYDFSETKKSWWWVQKDTYLISFGPVPGYNVMKEYQYSHWLPSYTGKVVVSKKSPDDAGVKN